jgi:hypothetical protein
MDKQTPTTTNPKSELPEVAQKPKPWQTYLKIFLRILAGLALVFVLLAASGLRITRKESLLDIWLASRRGTSPTPEVLATPTPDPTANWKSYRNPDNLYTLRYPESLFLIKEDNLAKNPNSACKTELVLADKEIGFTDKYQGNIVVDVCKIAEQFFPRSVFSNIEGTVTQDTVVDGKTAYVKSGEADLFKLGSKVQVKRVTVYKDGYAYTLDSRHIPGSRDYTKEFNQILSSFKFIQ